MEKFWLSLMVRVIFCENSNTKHMPIEVLAKKEKKRKKRRKKNC